MNDALCPNRVWLPFRRARCAVGALLLSAVLTACGEPPADRGSPIAPILAEARVVFAPPGVPMAAGYFRLTNAGKHTLSLTKISSPDFGAVELHETVVEGGISKMRPLHAPRIEPGETLVLEPGGKHLMLSTPAENLDRDAGIRLHLELAIADQATPVIVDSWVPAESASPGTSSGHH